MSDRSVVLNRTIFYDYSHNRYRKSDWGLVNTELGAMYELLPLDPVFESKNKLDMDDDFFRIDHINFDWDIRMPVIFDEGTIIHGGISRLGQTAAHSFE